MVIKYYGTAAAEGVPGIFCSCDVCEKSRVLGGKNIRTRSQACIDGRLLIDFPPDTYLHCQQYGLDMTTIKNLIFTHPHKDHFYAQELTMLRQNMSYPKDISPLNIYCVKPIADAIVAESSDHPNNALMIGRIKLNIIESFKTFNVENYTVTPLLANHTPHGQANIFDITDGKKRILYAHDTGFFPDETWEYLKSASPKYDLVSLDCTVILVESRNYHMGVTNATNVKDELISRGYADKNTKFMLNHFSHNGGLCYDDLLPVAEKFGFEVSYDTLEVEI